MKELDPPPPMGESVGSGRLGEEAEKLEDAIISLSFKVGIGRREE